MRPGAMGGAFRKGFLLRAAACALLAGAVSGAALCQDLRITSRTDRTRLRIGENLIYTVVLSGAGSPLPQPALPPLPGFKSVGQYMTPEASGGGLAYHYLLTPLRAGRLEVPDFDLRISGQTYPVRGFVADVEMGSAVPSSSPAQARGASPAVPSDGDLALSGALSSPRVYQGQPVIYTLHLLTRRSVRGLEMVQNPDFSGFQRVEDPQATQSATHQITRDGKVYLDVVVRRAALFPLQSGRLAIDPFTAQLKVDASGGGGAALAAVTGGQATLEVLPLPSPPPGFKGAVGSFTLSPVSPPPSRVDMGQPFTLVLRIEGAGFLPEDPIEGPTTPFFAPYPSTSEDQSGFEGEAYRTRRTVRVPMLPKVSGDAVLPPTRLVFFDPADRAYRTLEAGGGKVLVSGEGSPTRQEVSLAPLLREPKSGPVPEKAMARSLFWLFLLLPFGINALLGLTLWVLRTFFVSPERARARSLGRKARRGLAHARRSLDVRKGEAFHDALGKALTAVLDLRVGRATGGLSRDQLAEALAETAGEGKSDEILALRDALETARYAPERPTRQDLQARYDAVAKLLKETGA